MTKKMNYNMELWTGKEGFFWSTQLRKFSINIIIFYGYNLLLVFFFLTQFISLTSWTFFLDWFKFDLLYREDYIKSFFFLQNIKRLFKYSIFCHNIVWSFQRCLDGDKYLSWNLWVIQIKMSFLPFNRIFSIHKNQKLNL
jgi:hypothetical protein